MRRVLKPGRRLLAAPFRCVVRANKRSKEQVRNWPATPLQILPPQSEAPTTLKAARGSGQAPRRSHASAPARAGFQQNRASDAKRLRSMHSIPNPSPAYELSSICSTAGIARLAMTPKSCSLCGKVATFALGFMLSTLRRAKRQQKCTASIPLCFDCIQAIGRGMESAAPATLVEPLIDAYTAFAPESNDESHPEIQASRQEQSRSESTREVRPEASCRPCVTPCNSRQFDEVEKE